MASESTERKTFNTYKAALIKLLGDKALDDATINKVGKASFAAWGGCVPIDRVKLKPYHYYVVNTDPHDKPGTHWLACFTTAGKAYIYDSYGRPVKPLASQLITTINKSGMKLGKTNLVPRGEQIGYSSEVCGQISLSWLLAVRDLGITRTKNI